MNEALECIRLFRRIIFSDEKTQNFLPNFILTAKYTVQCTPTKISPNQKMVRILSHWLGSDFETTYNLFIQQKSNLTKTDSRDGMVNSE
uniref:Uncharacterized protein n=1 Tax=Romanomermis culicivorax TaxID=13658 RepID=A0A915K7Z3_ROMCU